MPIRDIAAILLKTVRNATSGCFSLGRPASLPDHVAFLFPPPSCATGNNRLAASVITDAPIT